MAQVAAAVRIRVRSMVMRMTTDSSSTTIIIDLMVPMEQVEGWCGGLVFLNDGTKKQKNYSRYLSNTITQTTSHHSHKQSSSRLLLLAGPQDFVVRPCDGGRGSLLRREARTSAVAGEADVARREDVPSPGVVQSLK